MPDQPLADTEAAPATASALARQLKGGLFVVTAELTPPVSTDPAAFIARALPLKGLATAVNVTDGARAKAHLSSVAAAYFLLANGIEPILQMTCRDRNRIALQSDLLGAMALGIRNVLILTGDDPKAGDQPDAKPVFDLDSSGLLATAHRLRTEHRLPPDVEVKGELGLLLGGADVPADPPPDWVPKSLMGKVKGGADFVQTQFCMDMGVVRRYGARLVELGIAPNLAVLIGVAPLPSAAAARWMRENLFGTQIPDAIIDRLDKAADPKVEGRLICAEIIRELADIPGIAGAHVMAPRNPSAIPETIAAAGVAGLKRAGA
jgi:methylenetetrahydrofolate reductase (NADPH)